MLGVRTSALRVWEAAGLLSSRRDGPHGYRAYTEPQIQTARVIHLLRQGGYLFERIRPVLDALHRAGSTETLMSAITERHEVLAQRFCDAIHAAALVDAYVQLLDGTETSPTL